MRRVIGGDKEGGGMVRTAVDYLVYLVVRLAICVMQAIPPESYRPLARWGAWLMHDMLRVRRKITAENLRHAFPERTDEDRDDIARRMWENLLLMVYEVAQAPRKIHDTNVRDLISLPTRGAMVANLFDPRPCVFISAHFGNFEVAGHVMGVVGFPSYTIARTLDNPFLDQYLNEFRSLHGQYILPKHGSAPLVQGVLDSGGTLVLLGDQYAGPKGCFVRFFNRPASCHKAVALFTLVSGAPLVTVFSRRLDNVPLRLEILVDGVADPLAGGAELASVKDLTQWYSDVLERNIRRQPDQYWWLHDRWKEKPRKAKGSAAAPQRTDPAHAAAGPHASQPTEEAAGEPLAAPAAARAAGGLSLWGWLRGETAADDEAETFAG